MENRKRLKPWLKRKVEMEENGLKWIDKELQIFSIPWAHKSNRSWNKVDCQIFKEWAKVTGKYREGEPEDWPSWKTRLRTALTKLPDFEERSEFHNLDSVDNPYKAYRFVENKDPLGVIDSPPSTNDSAISSQPSPYFDALSSPFSMEEMEVDSPPTNTGCAQACNIPNIALVLSENVNVYNPSVGMNIPVSTAMPACIEVSKPYQQMSPTHPQKHLASDLECVDSNNLIPKLPSNDVNMYKNDPVLKYRIYYGNRVIYSNTLFNSGVFLYHGQSPKLLNYDIHEAVYEQLEKIKFPDLAEVEEKNLRLTSKQEKDLKDILSNMDRGFLLRCEDGCIYAKRFCRTRIFATNAVIGNLVIDRKSKQDTKLFDLKYLKERCQNMKFSPVTVLTFAQELRHESFDKIVVHMELSPFDEDKDDFHSSFKSSLQFSDFDSGDHLAAVLSSIALGNE